MGEKDLLGNEMTGELMRVGDAARVLGITEAELRQIFVLGGVRGAFTPHGMLLLQRRDVERIAREMTALKSAMPASATRRT